MTRVFLSFCSVRRRINEIAVNAAAAAAAARSNDISVHVLFFDTRQRRFVHHAVLATAYQPRVTVHTSDEPVRVSGKSEPRVRFELGRDRVRVDLIRATESDYVCKKKINKKYVVSVLEGNRRTVDIRKTIIFIVLSYIFTSEIEIITLQILRTLFCWQLKSFS